MLLAKIRVIEAIFPIRSCKNNLPGACDIRSYPKSCRTSWHEQCCAATITLLFFLSRTAMCAQHSHCCSPGSISNAKQCIMVYQAMKITQDKARELSLHPPPTTKTKKRKSFRPFHFVPSQNPTPPDMRVIDADMHASRGLFLAAVCTARSCDALLSLGCKNAL